MTAADRDALAAELERAHAAGELRASSDPDLTFTLHIFGVEPGWFGAAFEGEAMVGFVMPDLKAAVVRPDHRRRGIGRRLMDLGGAIEGRRGRSDLYMGSVPEDRAAAAFLEATGFTIHSTAWNLDLPPDREVPEPVWPDDVIVRTFDRNRDVAALPAIVNVAFADHPTPIVMEEEMVRASLEDPDLLDEDVILLEARATGELVGFCMNEVRRSGGVLTSTHGEIGMVGVLPALQGRGLGRQLLRAGARYLRAAGAPNVGLAVNARNENALGLYESEGYVRARARDRWARPIPGGGA